MSKLEINSEQDRLTVATILVKNGYTVRQVKEKITGKKISVYCLEYTKSNKNTEEEKEK